MESKGTTYRWLFEELEGFSKRDWEKCFIILYRIARRIIGEIKEEDPNREDANGPYICIRVNKDGEIELKADTTTWEVLPEEEVINLS